MDFPLRASSIDTTGINYMQMSHNEKDGNRLAMASAPDPGQGCADCSNGQGQGFRLNGESAAHRMQWLAVWMGVALLSGCAAITNPVANGVPVRLLPEELLVEPKGHLDPIPLTWLRTKPQEHYTLDTGDVLGVFIEGVLGEAEQLPPIHFPDVGNLPPSVGFPIPIREDGTVPLPLVKPIDVRGLTLSEAQDRILAAYTEDRQIIQPDEARVLVTLVMARRVKIRVVREDSATGPSSSSYGGFNLYGSAPIPQRGAGRGMLVELPETEADLLSVLAETGGLPGPDAANEVIIQRGYRGSEALVAPSMITEQMTTCGPHDWGAFDQEGWPSYVRIPLRWYKDAAPPFNPEDVRLRDGDVVFIPALDVQAYYTGGLLPAREVPLPRDFDLGAVEAVLRVGGPLINGGFNANNLAGGLVTAGIGNPSPSLLTVIRRTPDGRLVNIRVNLNRAVQDPRENLLIQSGDVLVLQETPQEAIARYFSNVINFSFIGRMFEGASGSGTVTAVVP